MDYLLPTQPSGALQHGGCCWLLSSGAVAFPVSSFDLFLRLFAYLQTFFVGSGFAGVTGVLIF
jgi:hypothetical protein